MECNLSLLSSHQLIIRWMNHYDDNGWFASPSGEKHQNIPLDESMGCFKVMSASCPVWPFTCTSRWMFAIDRTVLFFPSAPMMNLARIECPDSVCASTSEENEMGSPSEEESITSSLVDGDQLLIVMDGASQLGQFLSQCCFYLVLRDEKDTLEICGYLIEFSSKEKSLTCSNQFISRIVRTNPTSCWRDVWGHPLSTRAGGVRYIGKHPSWPLGWHTL